MAQVNPHLFSVREIILSIIFSSLDKIRPPKWMRLSIPDRVSKSRFETAATQNLQDPLIKTNNTLIRKQQIEILDRLRHPKTFLFIPQADFTTVQKVNSHVVNGAVAELGFGVFGHCGPHVPADFAPVRVACYAVHVPDAFDGFGTEDVASCTNVDVAWWEALGGDFVGNEFGVGERRWDRWSVDVVAGDCFWVVVGRSCPCWASAEVCLG